MCVVDQRCAARYHPSKDGVGGEAGMLVFPGELHAASLRLWRAVSSTPQLPIRRVGVAMASCAPAGSGLGHSTRPVPRVDQPVRRHVALAQHAGSPVSRTRHTRASYPSPSSGRPLGHRESLRGRWPRPAVLRPDDLGEVTPSPGPTVRSGTTSRRHSWRVFSDAGHGWRDHGGGGEVQPGEGVWAGHTAEAGIFESSWNESGPARTNGVHTGREEANG